MKPHTPEQIQHMREAFQRRVAAMTPAEFAAWKERCEAFGRKSWCVRSEEEKSAQIARLQRPDARANNAASIRKAKAARFAEDPAWLSKILQEKWRRQDPLTLKQRKARSVRSKAQMANASPEKRQKFADAARRAAMKEVVGASLSDPADVRTFESATAAAHWLVGEGRSASVAGARHCIYQVCAGARKSACGYRWSYVSAAPRGG